MANTIALRRRIKSVKSTRQITKAMELVSASKMRRAQESALASREYAQSALQILTRLRELTDVSEHPLYKIRPIKSKLYIVITSDRGLAGAYDSNVLRSFGAHLKDDVANGVVSSAILLGKKAGRFAVNLQNLNIIGVYDHMPEKPNVNDLSSILSTAKSAFLGKNMLNSEDTVQDPRSKIQDLSVDAVEIIYTNYKSSIVQEVTEATLLPAALSDVETSIDVQNDLFEPNPHEVLRVVTERLIEVQLYQAYLESQASEQSARMMAMKTASDNASDIIEDLTLAANTARQSAITQELAEITGGAEAMK